MKSARRVARPRRTGSTPSANGSRVPAWPIRFWPARRRTRPTTSCEVQPFGLLTLRIPVKRSGLAMLALLLNVAHQAHDAVAARQRAINNELEVRNIAQVQSALEVAMKKAGRPLQMRLDRGNNFLVAKNAEVNL